MKKLIVLSVVFALVAATAAFAVDLGANVINTVDLVKSDTAKDANDEATKITSGASFNRLRIDGGGEAGDGKFGGYFRLDGVHWSGNAQYFGNAWWKPIDQFKLLVGSNGGDGFIGKEGVTGWMFYQTPCDTGVSMGGDNVWGGSLYGFGINTRSAFFEGGGDGGDNVYLFITPLDMLKINVILPFFGGGEMADVFKKAVAQIDLNLDFGNIALTYVGGLGADDDNDDPGSIFVYYGGSFGDLSIDFGFGYKMDGKQAGTSYKNPMGIGLGLKYATDAFGVKFRVVANMAGEDESTKILTDIMPYFPLGDNLTAFISVGIGMAQPKEGDSVLGWHFNPYLQIGEEWGAKFLVGIKLWTAGDADVDAQGNKGVIHWGIPIALNVSF